MLCRGTFLFIPSIWSSLRGFYFILIAKGSRRHWGSSSCSFGYFWSQKNNRTHFLPGSFWTARQLGSPWGLLSPVANARADGPSPAQPTAALCPPAQLLPSRRRFPADWDPSASLRSSRDPSARDSWQCGRDRGSWRKGLGGSPADALATWREHGGVFRNLPAS